jgi:1,5-anhydro-D-fructose reductase (1,5-anhydro-D-mannitol-forming)
MPRMLSVGIIGIGAIGRLHFDCWRKSPHARVAAIASRDPRKRAGDWRGSEFNLGDQAAERVDLSGIAAYERAEELIADPAVDIVDICSATPLHAPLTVAALRAGKHVVCEKPMALSREECAQMEDAARASGRQLMIAHCLRYWPHYVRAKEMLDAGELGRPLYARFHRSGGAPGWSAGGWLMKPERSGGVLDMYIHDIDVALWWFGRPAAHHAIGVVRDGVPLIVDSQWRYSDGPSVMIHGAWDPNGGAFRHAFRLVGEKGTLAYDLAVAPGVLQLFRGDELTELAMPEPAAHQAELDDFARCVAEGHPFTRFTPAESRLAVELGLEELRQLTG